MGCCMSKLSEKVRDIALYASLAGASFGTSCVGPSDSASESAVSVEVYKSRSESTLDSTMIIGTEGRDGFSGPDVHVHYRGHEVDGEKIIDQLTLKLPISVHGTIDLSLKTQSSERTWQIDTTKTSDQSVEIPIDSGFVSLAITTTFSSGKVDKSGTVDTETLRPYLKLLRNMPEF